MTKSLSVGGVRMKISHPLFFKKENMNNVLTITSSADAHFSYISEILKRRGAKVMPVLINDGLWKNKYKLSFLGGLSIDGFGFEDDTTIWYRKPELKRMKTEPWIGTYVENENRAFIDNIESITCCRWIHSPTKLRMASNKLTQLSRAKRYKLLIPETLVTNVPSEVESFFDVCDGKVIGKALGPQVVEKNDKIALGLRTTVIKKEYISDGLLEVPMILQRQVNISHEVRVVLIGQDIFSFGMRPCDGSAKSDIKLYRLNEIDHFLYTLSKETEKRFLALAKSFDLEFCSADFLVTRDGEEVFLELNPNGQWLWLEFLTKVPLSSRFVDLLLA